MSDDSIPLGAKSTYGAQHGKTRSQSAEIERQLLVIDEEPEE
jgi:hypothetical protein